MSSKNNYFFFQVRQGISSLSIEVVGNSFPVGFLNEASVPELQNFADFSNIDGASKTHLPFNAKPCDRSLSSYGRSWLVPVH